MLDKILVTTLDLPVICHLGGSKRGLTVEYKEVVVVDPKLSTIYGVLELQNVKCAILCMEVDTTLIGPDVIRKRLK